MLQYIGIHSKNTNLSKILKSYQKGWVALNKQQTKVLAHAPTFAEINNKIKDENPDEVILGPIMRQDAYFGGYTG